MSDSDFEIETASDDFEIEVEFVGVNEAAAVAASAAAAATSATAAATSATAAATSATAAQTAKTAAETAETNAETAETNAETAQTAAAASASAAATSASNASTSASNAATSASNASTSATAAAASATAAAASYDSFDDRYLGAKSSDPTLDNDGNALLTGALYWNTSSSSLKVYDGAAWQAYSATGAPADAEYLVKTASTGLSNERVGAGTTSIAFDYGTAGQFKLNVQFGTGAGVAAEGNDSRITGAAQKASNLSDLASASTARTNLGLAALATLATVGTSQIDNDAVTYAKLQNVSATDKLLGRSSSGAGDVEEITCTAQGRALLDDANASDQRNTLGLGTVATLAETTTAEFLANTADKALSTDQVWGAGAEVTLTDAATIAVDMSTFINAVVTLAGNRALGNPSNEKVGQSGYIRIVQDGTGSRTLSYGTDWEFPGGTAPSLSTTAGDQDLLFYTVIATNRVFASLIKDIS